MEQQSKAVILWKPTKFMMNLAKNTTAAMAQMAKYTPTMITRFFDEHRHVQEALDTTDRSLRYFYEYEGKDKAKNIIMLKKQYDTLLKWLERTTAPKTLSVLAKENME